MKKLTSIILLIFIFSSCEQQELEKNLNTEESTIEDLSLKVTKDVIEKVELLNFNPDGIEVIAYPNLRGEFEEVFLIEKDIIMSPDQLQNLSSSDITSKQYRTNNLVNNFNTYDVFGYSSGSYSLTSKQQNALTRAVANFNELNIGIQFNLSFGASPSSQDIVVRQLNGNAGGVAGFPSNGNPYNLVSIYSGTESYSLEVNEHVLTHEIGHTIGLRHTDWFSRESCGSYDPEGESPYGAVHIPGTPTGFDSSSLMLSCFNSFESGNFGTNDVTALEYLYPGERPFSVTIIGPAKASNSGDYTWSANTEDGTAPYTYEWTRTDPSGIEHSWGGGQQSVTTNMPDGQDLELNLEVTDSDGNIATTYHFTMNTGSGGKPGF